MQSLVSAPARSSASRVSTRYSTLALALVAVLATPVVLAEDAIAPDPATTAPGVSLGAVQVSEGEQAMLDQLRSALGQG